MEQQPRRTAGRDNIFSEQKRILPELRDEVRDIKTFAAEPDAAVILHLSTGSAVNDLFASLPLRKIVRYHNVTPPDCFHGIAEQTARPSARAAANRRKHCRGKKPSWRWRSAPSTRPT